MQSAALRHFPRIVYRKGVRWLWNPILKKAFKNRPEERVRLRLIDFLMLEVGWSPHRISMELPLRLRHDEYLKRADILCYHRDLTPALLVECKAERVIMNHNTGRQIAAYNEKVKAPFLMVSNGLEDFYFKLSENGVERLHQLPGILVPAGDPPDLHFRYWEQRGFTGKNASPALRPWLTEALDHFWGIDNNEPEYFPRYLEFRRHPGYLSLNHYYRVFNPEDGIKLAVTFLATPFGGNRLVGIVNIGDTNTAILELNLELLSEASKQNTTIFSTEGERVIDASPFIPLDFNTFNSAQLDGIPAKLLALYNYSLI